MGRNAQHLSYVRETEQRDRGALRSWMIFPRWPEARRSSQEHTPLVEACETVKQTSGPADHLKMNRSRTFFLVFHGTRKAAKNGRRLNFLIPTCTVT